MDLVIVTRPVEKFGGTRVVLIGIDDHRMCGERPSVWVGQDPVRVRFDLPACMAVIPQACVVTSWRSSVADGQ